MGTRETGTKYAPEIGYFNQYAASLLADHEGKKVYDIELSAKSGATLTVTLDAKSHLMVEQSFKVHSPLGSMPVTIRSTDYRGVDGMKIPYKQVTDASLMELTQELTVVELNAPVDEATFAMPTGDVPVVVRAQGEAFWSRSDGSDSKREATLEFRGARGR